jgi:hypothetical protein
LEGFHNLHIVGEIDDTALLRVMAVRTEMLVIIPEMGISNEIETKEVILIQRLSKIQQKYYAITRQRLHPNPDVRFLIESGKQRK